MKTTIIALPILFTNEFMAIIEKTTNSSERLGKDQDDHELVKITYSEEKQVSIDKIHSDIKKINQFITEASTVFEKMMLELCVEIGEIIKKLGLNPTFDINGISKN
jgi:hypothetical protein